MSLNGNGGPGVIRPPRKCRTAFIVLVDEEGAAVAVGDIGVEVEIERPATINDMVRACAEVERDIASSQTAQRVIQMLGSIQEQQRAALQIKGLGDLRGN